MRFMVGTLIFFLAFALGLVALCLVSVPLAADAQPAGKVYRIGILIVQAGTNLNIPGRNLEVATSNRIPTMYPDSFWTKFGALASYGPDPYLQGRQAAQLANKILTGTAPGQIPIELPDRIEFIVNLKTAKRLGLEVPRPIPLRADRVID